MAAEPVLKAYTPEGIKAVATNFQVVAPPIYLTGYLEFQDALGKNLRNPMSANCRQKTC